MEELQIRSTFTSRGRLHLCTRRWLFVLLHYWIFLIWFNRNGFRFSIQSFTTFHTLFMDSIVHYDFNELLKSGTWIEKFLFNIVKFGWIWTLKCTAITISGIYVKWSTYFQKCIMLQLWKICNYVLILNKNFLNDYLWTASKSFLHEKQVEVSGE